jgi:Ca-activated chloride channel family protein
MSFASPAALVALLIVPILLLGYLWLLRRRRRAAVRFSNLALIRQALPRHSQWRRHIPVAAFLAAIAMLAIAMARPQLTSDVPLSRTSIILTLEVWGSMCATDVTPNRLAAAQAAAKDFVKHQVAGTRIGIVAFANFAQLLVPPTTDHKALTDAIDNLTTARGTVIGVAELQALDALASVNPDIPPVGSDVEAQADQGGGFGSAQDTTPPDTTPAPVPPGGYEPDIIVLLTDGANTRGISPVDAAQQAAQRRVRIYTIGFGTDNPLTLSCSPEQLGAGAFDRPFGGGGGGFTGGGGGGGGFQGGGGRRSFLTIDEDTLKAVAAQTGGQYYQAQDATQLRNVFASLPSDIHHQREQHEISVWFVILGALLAAGAFGSSLWLNRS